jgi:H+-transporting ATPase
MWEVTVVSVVLGAVACLSSMILLVLILKANYGHYKLSGSSSTTGLMFGEQGYVTWMEARTIMYLKISISDFLTLFSARTRVWFWERRPGYALGVACIVATGSSTLLSLFWDKIMKDQDSYMKGLSGSYACLSTWAYCIAWFVVQDVCKVLTYKTLEFLSEKDHQRLARAELRAKVSVGAPRRRWHRRPPPPSSSLSPSPAPLFLTDNPTPCRSPPSSTRTKRRSAFAAALTPRGATVHWQSSAPATPSLLRRCST